MSRPSPLLLLTILTALAACSPDALHTIQSSRALEAGVSDAGLDGGPSDTGVLAADFQVAEFTAFVSGGMLEAQLIVCNYGTAPDYFDRVQIVAQPDADPAQWAPRPPQITLFGWGLVAAGACESLRGRAPVTNPGWDPVFIAEVDPTQVSAELDETNNYLASRRVSITGAADLVVTHTEWSQNGYEQTNFVSEVCNQGNAANAYTGLEIFTGPVSLSSYYGGRNIPVLQPGECTLVAWGVSGYGNTLVNASVEVNSPTIGAVPEIEYGNNRSDAPFSFTQGGFDLVVRSAQLPDTLTQPARVRAQVCNAGTLPSPLNATLDVYLSGVDTIPAPGATARGTTTLPSLAPSECHDVELLVDSQNLAYGRTHVGLLLDASGQAADPASNNWRSVGWRVPPHAAPTPLADLITRPVQRLDASPGAGAFSVDICNVGDAPAAPCEFIVTGRLTNSAPPAGYTPRSITGAGINSVKALDPGECSTVPFTYQVSPSVAHEEFVSVWVDPFGNIAEHDATNNHSKSARAVFRTGANFQLESVHRAWSQGTVFNAGEVVSFRVCNNGDQTGSWNGDVAYGQADTADVIGTPASPPAPQRINLFGASLIAGECIDLSFDRPFVRVQNAWVASSYLQLVGAPQADMRSALVRLPPPTFSASVFHVTDFSAPPVAAPGQSFGVVTRLCGDGGQWPDDIVVYGSRDTKGEAPAVWLGSWAQDAIAPGVCLTRTDTVLAPVADRLTRIGVTRYGPTRPELLAARRITFASGIDYTSRIITAPPQASGALSAQVEVCNPGDVSGPPSDVSLLLSWDDEFMQPLLPAPLSDLAIGSTPVPGIAAGACVTVNVSGDVTGVPLGTRMLGSYVDYAGSITEIREDDNASPGQALQITAPVCGDASLDTNEQCDDGNLIRGDGCDELCAIEVRAALGEVIYTGANNQQLTHAIAAANHPLNPTNAFTFALWAREPASPWETPANRWDSSGKVWNFSHDSNGRMTLAINDGSGARSNGRSFATPPGRGRNWVHYAMTFQLGVVHLYRNGVLDDGAVSGTIPSLLTGGISDFHLGHWMYNGAMGNVMFVDRAVSASEIADIFCALSDDPTLCSCGADQHPCSASDVLNLPGLVSYWPMTSGPQDVVGGYDFTEQGSNWVYNDRTPVAPAPDAGVIDTGILPDSGLHPDAALHDSGVSPDTGVLPDSGVPPDTGILPDTGLPPDAALPDSGVPPDTGVAPDSGVLADTGVLPDASVMDAGQIDAGAPAARARQGEVIYVAGRGQRLTYPITTSNHPLNPTDAFSFALWAREPATPWETPANRWDGSGKVWNFSHDSSGFISFAINDGSGSRGNGRRFATRPTSHRPWVHYAMTYDRGTVHVYRNGLADDGALQGVLPTVLTGGVSDLHLGHGIYNGAMGNVTFFDRALTASDVSDLHCALSDDPSLCSCGPDQHACSEADVLGMSGLVSYWPLTTGPQDIVSGYDFVEEGTGWIYNDRTPAPSIDAGVLDAGAPLDSGVAPDSGVPVDSGVAPDSGLVPDTGVPADSGVAVDAGAPGDVGIADAGPPSVNGPVQFATFNASLRQSLDVAVPTASPLDTSAFTIAMWTRAPQSQWTALAKRWDSQSGDVWLLSEKFANTLFLSISDAPTGGNANVGREFATPVFGGEWMHLIMTYSQGVVHLYRSGVSDDGPIRGTIPPALSGAPAPLSIGHWMYSGSIGSVLYYDRAVSSVEAQDIYCAFSANPGACPCSGPSCTLSDVMSMPGLVSYWPLDRDGADVVGGQSLTEVNGPLLFTPGGP